MPEPIILRPKGGLRAAGHKLAMEWSGEHGIESTSTGTCKCGAWSESASNRDEVAHEYAMHLGSVLGLRLTADGWTPTNPGDDTSDPANLEEVVYADRAARDRRLAELRDAVPAGMPEPGGTKPAYRAGTKAVAGTRLFTLRRVDVRRLVPSVTAASLKADLAAAAAAGRPVTIVLLPAAP